MAMLVERVKTRDGGLSRSSTRGATASRRFDPVERALADIPSLRITHSRGQSSIAGKPSSPSVTPFQPDGKACRRLQLARRRDPRGWPTSYGSPRTRFIQQPVEPRGQKPTAPPADGLLRPPQLVRDLGIRATARARQDKSRSLRQRLCRRRPTRPALQRVAFLVGQRQHRNGSTDGRERSPFYPENAQCVDVVPSFSDETRSATASSTRRESGKSPTGRVSRLPGRTHTSASSGSARRPSPRSECDAPTSASNVTRADCGSDRRSGMPGISPSSVPRGKTDDTRVGGLSDGNRMGNCWCCVAGRRPGDLVAGF
jgi:hypothetical protein